MGNNSAARMTGRTCVPFRAFLNLAIVLLISGSLHRAAAQSTGEYKIKAAFLFHFAQLVEWPPDNLNSADQPLEFCVFEDEVSRQDFKSALEGKLIGTRVLQVRLLSQSQGVQGCNILFLSHDQGRRQAAVLKSIHGLPVLTVGETGSFISDGGMIRFHLDGDKIRFDINLDGADSSHLKISSRLLLLATSVTHGDGTDRGR